MTLQDIKSTGIMVNSIILKLGWSKQKFYDKVDRGLSELDQTKINSMGKVKYSLCGYRPRARAKPFIVLNLLDNKKYLLSEEKAEKFFGQSDWEMEVKTVDFKPRTKGVA